MKRLSTSSKIYLGLVVAMIALRAVLQNVQVERLIPWPVVTAAVVLGLVGVQLAPHSGFPEFLSSEVSDTQRFVVPVLVGLGFGIAIVVLDVISPLGEVHAPFPDSLAVYGFAALFEEIILRLFLTTFLVWLISRVILRGRAQKLVFWAVAVGVAVLYLLVQLNAYATHVGVLTLPILVQMVLLIGVYSVVAAYVFRKAGLFAPEVMRLSFYLVWHIIWGAI